MSSNLDIKWLIIIGLGIYILFLQQCGDNQPCEDTVTTTIDTVYKQGRSDTTFIEVEKPIYIRVEIPVPTTITVNTPEGPLEVREYTSSISDSLISGTIVSQVDGVLVSQVLNYVPLFPKYINRVDTFIVDRTNTIVKQKNYIGIGAEIGGTSATVNVSPKLSLVTKKGYIYSYRYGLLDKSHNISIVKKFNIKEVFNK